LDLGLLLRFALAKHVHELHGRLQLRTTEPGLRVFAKGDSVPRSDTLSDRAGDNDKRAILDNHGKRLSDDDNEHNNNIRIAVVLLPKN
jgi:hypothetical protein